MAGERRSSWPASAILRGSRCCSTADRFAVIAYDTVIDVVMPLTRRHIAKRARTQSASSGQIDSRGARILGGGWLSGCQQVAEAISHSNGARCLLMSDGQANQGITAPGDLGATLVNCSSAAW